MPRIINFSLMTNPVNWLYVLACMWVLAIALHVVVAKTNSDKAQPTDQPIIPGAVA